jgi:hypothetical protein
LSNISIVPAFVISMPLFMGGSAAAFMRDDQSSVAFVFLLVCCGVAQVV